MNEKIFNWLYKNVLGIIILVVLVILFVRGIAWTYDLGNESPTAICGTLRNQTSVEIEGRTMYVREINLYESIGKATVELSEY